MILDYKCTSATRRQLNCRLGPFLICRLFMRLLVSHYLLMRSFITEEPSRESPLPDPKETNGRTERGRPPSSGRTEAWRSLPESRGVTGDLSQAGRGAQKDPTVAVWSKCSDKGKGEKRKKWRVGGEEPLTREKMCERRGCCGNRASPPPPPHGETVLLKR